MSDYPQTKERTEVIIQEQRERFLCWIARIAGGYDDEGYSMSIAHQIQRIYERQLTARFYPGDLDRGEAFVHRADLVDAIRRIIGKRAELPRKGLSDRGGHHAQLRDIADAIRGA